MSGADEAVDLLALVFGDAASGFEPMVRVAHRAPLRAEGFCDVQVPYGWFGAWLVDRCQLPRRGKEVAVGLECDCVDGGVRWRRRFGEQVVESVLRLTSDGIEEACGSVALVYSLSCEEGALRYRQVGFFRNGRRLPAWLSPRTTALVSPADRGWTVDVAVALPLLGTICRYGGRMEAV